MNQSFISGRTSTPRKKKEEVGFNRFLRVLLICSWNFMSSGSQLLEIYLRKP